MTVSGKKKLSARQVVEDIRSGIDWGGLKRKHGLSDQMLQSVCSKLSAAGALTENEIARLRPLRDGVNKSHQPQERAVWRCPACNAPQREEMAECPVCGVIVEKYVARSGRDDHVLTASVRVPVETPTGGSKSWVPNLASVVIFVIAGSSLLLWSTHRANQTHEVAASKPDAESVQTAETEEDQTQEDTNELESIDKDHKEVEIGNIKDIVVIQPPVVASQQSPERVVATPREAAPPPPREEASSGPEKSPYVTGVLRQFSSRDFKNEVVEASKTYPVLFQFYSQT